jgi:hypothetical protein
MIRFLLAAFIFCATFAHGEEKIWSALVLASDPQSGRVPLQPPPELADYARKLTKIFGYQQFEILGTASKAMGRDQQERWLVPSPTFMVGAQAKRVGAEYLIQLEVFQESRRLVQAEAKLGVQSPLFIAGPRHARGQLLVVFEIRP